MTKPKLHLGFCGWSYDFLVGKNNFYPPGTKKADMLEEYRTKLGAVEFDAPFYWRPKEGKEGPAQWPGRDLTERWAEFLPADFHFCSKAPGLMTHDKKLRDCKAELDAFLDVMAPLGKRFKAMLVEIPFSFEADEEALEFFLDDIDGRVPVAFEPRHFSWRRTIVRDLLTEHNAAWVNTDKFKEPVYTADWTYLRFLGSRKDVPDDRQGELVIDRSDRLERWANYLKSLPSGIRRAYVFLNNHFEGSAHISLSRLEKLLAG